MFSRRITGRERFHKAAVGGGRETANDSRHLSRAFLGTYMFESLLVLVVLVLLLVIILSFTKCFLHRSQTSFSLSNQIRY